MLDIITQPDTPTEWTGSDLRELFTSSFHWIAELHPIPDRINIWPAPDGDTGTNFTLTLSGGITELPQNGATASDVLSKFTRGTMMEARGNGGVILSQIIRGMARSLEGAKKVNAKDFTAALLSASEYAYKSVVRPVEGTILTVIRESAKSVSENSDDNMVEILSRLVSQSLYTVAETPELLPIFRQAGVVDAGALALAMFFEGALKWAKGKPVPQPISIKWVNGRLDWKYTMSVINQNDYNDNTMMGNLDWELEHIRSFADLKSFELSLFSLTKSGKYVDIITSSLIQNFLRRCIDLSRATIDIEKRRWLRSSISFWASLIASSELDYYPYTSLSEPDNILTKSKNNILSRKKASKVDTSIHLVHNFPIVAVASGEGITSLFYNLGCNQVIDGGETMNPSARDILTAINSIKSNIVVLLPNSKQSLAVCKMILDEQQTNREMVILSTLSIAGGLSALTAINPDLSLAENVALMSKHLSAIRTASITRAIRDADVSNIRVKKGDFMTIYENEIISANHSLGDAFANLTNRISNTKARLIDIIYGNDSSLEEALKIYNGIHNRLVNADEINLINGGQPLYPYVILITP